MGNQVLIAIRHDIDRDNIPLFQEQRRLGLHTAERVPKSYSLTDKIIVSNYHHSSDHVCLGVTNKMMKNLPAYLELFQGHMDGKPADAYKNMIDGYRKYRYGSVAKSRKKVTLVPNEGEKVSLFGYLTDETSSMPENAFALMVAAIDSMSGLVNGQTDIIGWEQKLDPTPIHMIGTIDANQMALVELYGNIFSATAIPANKIEEPEHFTENRDQIIAFDKEFLKSYGYELTPKSSAHFL
jgi:hypothetical protein